MRETSGAGAITWNADGLVPVVAQDGRTGEVLMMAWMNEAALAATVATGVVHFWSRSRGELWEKGATSGNRLSVLSIAADCDGDTLLVQVDPAGPACHTGTTTCFGDAPTARQGFQELEHLWATIVERRETASYASYTSRLIGGGAETTGRKLIEEASETVEAALAHAHGAVDNGRVAEEAADVLYHLLVVLAERNIDPATALAELARRRAHTVG